MSTRLLLLILLSIPVWSQIQVLLYDGVSESPIGAVVDIGAAAPGDTLTARLRVRDIGAGPAVLSTLSLSGSGFQLAAYPSLPYTIAPGSETEFKIAFSPAAIGSYSAFLLVNTANIIVRGSAVASPVLALAGSNAPIAAGSTIDFGQLARGGSQVLSFTLSNTGTSTITVNPLSVTGAGFRGPISQTAPISLPSGQLASFQVAFEPQSGQPYQGTLLVGPRSFNLIGQGLDPPLPAAAITFASTLGTSAQQNSVSIPLASASPVSGTGTLTMTFHSSVPGISDDPAVQFVTGPKRAATVTISAGAALASFGKQSSIGFQTGTTAGAIVFTLTLPESTQQATLTIAPGRIGFDSTTAVRRVNDLDVSLIGFDNTYTASQLQFTFYDLKGAVLKPGAITVDASTYFKLYFSASPVGGMFAMLASFPVIGDVTQVGSVVVEATNSAGTTTTQPIQFGTGLAGLVPGG